MFHLFDNSIKQQVLLLLGISLTLLITLVNAENKSKWDDKPILEVAYNIRNKGDRRASEFVELLELAGLDDILNDCDAGPYTLFVSNNKTFKRLGREDHRWLKKSSNKNDLRHLLEYSIVKGVYYKSDLIRMAKKRKDLETLDAKNDLEVDYDSDYDDVFLYRAKYKYDSEGAWIAKSNYEGCNGIVHVVNALLLTRDQDLL